MNDYALIFHRTGGPEVIERREIDAPPRPGPGEAVVRNRAVGLNFIDTYQRSGLYSVPLPSGLGVEGAGVVEAVGEGVANVSVGERVAYIGPLGAYATVRAMPADVLVRLPDSIDEHTAAAVMLKGLTADMLVGPCAKVQPGQWVLVHAAAGGVGSLLVPWLKAIGANVIAHAGSEEKAARAKNAGADQALSCPFEELADRIRGITGGPGAAVVLDGVGKASWDASLQSLAPRGIMASYGNASGPVPPFEPLALSRGGSLFLTRPSVFHYISTPEERDASAARLFSMIESGKVPVDIGQTFPLAQAADAHRALEARETTGSTILLP